MSNQFTIKGKVAQVFPTYEKGDFRKRQFLITYMSGTYEKKLIFTTFKDRISLVDSLVIGDEVDVFYNPESREHNSFWNTENIVWKVNVLKDGGQSSKGNKSAMKPETSFIDEEDGGDLPF